MGLDIVEFVMAVEEEFQIEIPNEIATIFVTPKDIIDYVFSQLGNEKKREEIAKKVWEILGDLTGINRKDYNENSRFIEDMGLD